MRYRGFKIIGQDLILYKRWLAIVELEHSDKVFELFCYDCLVDWVKTLKLKHSCKRYLNKNNIEMYFDKDIEILSCCYIEDGMTLSTIMIANVSLEDEEKDRVVTIIISHNLDKQLCIIENTRYIQEI